MFSRSADQGWVALQLAPPHPVREIHVWRARLDLPPECYECLVGYLSPGELERVRRLVFDANRRDFTMARGLLRVSLGRYLEVLPGRLVSRAIHSACLGCPSRTADTNSSST